MLGINVSMLDSAIKKNDLNCESLNDEIKRVTTNINELGNFYGGEDLNFLFQDILAQTSDITFILSIVKNYSEVLKNVKASYIAQDANIKSQVDYLTSKISI